MSKPGPTGPFDLSKSPIHLGAVATSVQHDFGFDGPAFGAYIEANCTDADGGRLVMIEESPTDWGSWECHNNADELVIVLEGAGTFIQQLAAGEVRTPFAAGDTFINPKGVWHTADVTAPMRAIYLTPCPGTEHRPR